MLRRKSTHRDVGPESRCVLRPHDLPAAFEYTRLIEKGVTGCDLFIVLLSPDSVKDRKFVLTEVDLVRRAWKNPSGRVYPS